MPKLSERPEPATRTYVKLEEDTKGNIDVLVRGEVRAIAWSKPDVYHIYDLRWGGKPYIFPADSQALIPFLKLLARDRIEDAGEE